MGTRLVSCRIWLSRSVSQCGSYGRISLPDARQSGPSRTARFGRFPEGSGESAVCLPEVLFRGTTEALLYFTGPLSRYVIEPSIRR
jgi:hypothetical protein